MFSIKKEVTTKSLQRGKVILSVVLPAIVAFGQPKNSVYASETDKNKIEMPTSSLSVRSLATDIISRIRSEDAEVKGLIENLFKAGRASGSKKDVERAYLILTDLAGVKTSKKLIAGSEWLTEKFSNDGNKGNYKIPEGVVENFFDLFISPQITAENVRIENFRLSVTLKEEVSELEIYPIQFEGSAKELSERVLGIKDNMVKGAADQIFKIVSGEETFCGPIRISHGQYADLYSNLSGKTLGTGDGQITFLSIVDGHSVYMSYDKEHLIGSLKPHDLYRYYYKNFVRSLNPNEYNSLYAGKPITIKTSLTDAGRILTEQSLAWVGYEIAVTKQDGTLVFNIDSAKLVSEARKITKRQFAAISECLKAISKNDEPLKRVPLAVLKEHLREAQRRLNLDYSTDLYNLVQAMREKPQAYRIIAGKEARQIVEMAGNSLARIISILEKERIAIIKELKKEEKLNASEMKPKLVKKPAKQVTTVVKEMKKQPTKVTVRQEAEVTTGKTAKPALGPTSIEQQNAMEEVNVDEMEKRYEQDSAGKEKTQVAQAEPLVIKEDAKPVEQIEKTLKPNEEQIKTLLETKLFKKFRKEVLMQPGPKRTYLDESKRSQKEVLRAFGIEWDGSKIYHFDFDFFTPMEDKGKLTQYKWPMTITVSPPDSEGKVHTTITTRSN